MQDIVVVGAGLVGATLALRLARSGANVTLLELRQPDAIGAEASDGRTTAVATGARRLFQELDLWQMLEPHAAPIRSIRVSDRRSLWHLHFDGDQASDEPMGHIVDNFRLRRVLLDAVQAHDRIEARWNTKAVALRQKPAAAEIVLANGSNMTARLAVAADGKGSALRRLAGIGVRAFDYDQTAVVCVVHHEHSHDGIAHERFLDGGPFAILPMKDGNDGSHRSSIVWTERRALAEHLLRRERSDLQQELARRFGVFLGSLTVPGPVWSYPLSLTFAHRLTDARLALIGEAAHSIHPIAGQGFNISARDIIALSDAVSHAVRHGQDPGAERLLHSYARKRWPDIFAMIAATDGLNRLFLSTAAPVVLGRRLGLRLVNQMSPLKNAFQRQAMGLGLFTN